MFLGFAVHRVEDFVEESVGCCLATQFGCPHVFLLKFGALHAQHS